jgi:hypothetical protein
MSLIAKVGGGFKTMVGILYTLVRMTNDEYMSQSLLWGE